MNSSLRELVDKVRNSIANMASASGEIANGNSDLSLSINKGEVLSLVGESGCGKSTAGRRIAGLLPPTSGDIAFEGKPLEASHATRHLDTQMVFQNPCASLNPRLRVGQLIGRHAL